MILQSLITISAIQSFPIQLIASFVPFELLQIRPVHPFPERTRAPYYHVEWDVASISCGKRLQQALHHSTFNIINRQRQLKRRRECLQRPSCLRSKVSQCFTSKKSAPTLSSVHLQTAVRSTTSPYKNTAMAATGTNPISRSQQSHKFASTPTTENTDRHNNIECTTEPDPLPQLHAKLRLHEYNSHLTTPRGRKPIPFAIVARWSCPQFAHLLNDIHAHPASIKSYFPKKTSARKLLASGRGLILSPRLPTLCPSHDKQPQCSNIGRKPEYRLSCSYSSQKILPCS